MRSSGDGWGPAAAIAAGSTGTGLAYPGVTRPAPAPAVPDPAGTVSAGAVSAGTDPAGTVSAVPVSSATSTSMMGVPTSTVWPSDTSRPVTTPSYGEGSSTTALAVSISTI